MKHFVDESGNLFAYPIDGTQDDLIGDKTPVPDEHLDVARQQHFDNLGYVQKRQLEYPSFLDYLDGIVKGDADQINRYIEACRLVKDKYPKE